MDAMIFDMDGVLIDSERVCLLAFRYAGEMTGLENVERMAYIGLGLNYAVWLQRLDEEFGPDADSVLEYFERYRKEFYSKQPAPVKAGVYELLQYLRLRGCSLAVASSTQTEVVKDRLERVGLAEYFQVIVGGDTIARSKPEPDIFLEAAARLGRAAEDCYVIEDSPNGLRAGKAAGCRTLFVPDLWQPDGERPDLYDARFADLGQALEFFRTIQ